MNISDANFHDYLIFFYDVLLWSLLEHFQEDTPASSSLLSKILIMPQED